MMKLFSDIFGFDTGPKTNPATGLPMIHGTGGVDVGGSPFGTDLHSDHGLESGSPFDPFGGGGVCEGGSFGGSEFSWD
jgi:hypothetical protein